MIHHDHHCGAWWMPTWLKKKLSKNFNGACAYHDDAYGKQEMPKQFIDHHFLSLMLRQSRNKRQMITAYVYFLFVKLFGWVSWHNNKIKTNFRKDQ